MDAMLERRLLGLLGLGARARSVVVGVEQVRDAARRGKLRLAVIAPDASENSREKVVPLLTARRIRMVEGPSAAALGGVVGRQATAAIGVVDEQLARGIRALLEASTGERPDGRPARAP
ncbi:MAG TPA: ribosomal L7Ae/L30e/S12e/Gadd45 family protein [Gemmatimonadaceae bacterium]|nr:ribosomal L7Ae/L30e/S12e/Gadd45 family protein [Gemmatimonadaceae bacterium]